MVRNIIIAILAILLCLAVIADCDASGNYYESHEHAVNHPDFSSQINDACATNTAISNIPGISHHVNHKTHTSLGLGLGICEGSTAAAIGINHQWQDMAFRGGIGTAGSTKAVGGGVSFGFK